MKLSILLLIIFCSCSKSALNLNPDEPKKVNVTIQYGHDTLTTRGAAVFCFPSDYGQVTDTTLLWYGSIHVHDYNFLKIDSSGRLYYKILTLNQ